MFDNLFSSSADTQQNSFANPLNAANLNPGWGINPNLLTPSYEAAYRPQYSGPQPYGAYGNPSMMSSLANTYGSDPQRWGNSVDNDRQYIESMSSKPFDSAVWVGQRVAMPIAGYGLAFGALGGVSRSLGRGIGQGVARGITGSFGGAFAESAVGRMAASGFATGLGAVSGVAAGFVLPALAGTAAIEGMQRALINPYINSRKEARDLRDNFRGVTFGDATGNAVSGQGLGGRESAQIASQLTRQGIKDNMFSTGEYADIADYSARAGLLDDAKSKQIAQRIKDITSQVKLVMALGNDPSIKDAVEELAKLHTAGASLVGGRSSVAAGAYSQMSQFAAASGRSVQNLMNTVGAQGQYLYQANGMTPYLGQLAAGNIIGSFEAARRQGLLTTGQIARMGGTDGGTQSSLTGQLTASQTLYSQMLLNNRLHGHGSANGNIIGTVSQYGQHVAQDPGAAMGEQILFGRQLAGKAIDQEGSKYVEGMTADIIKMAMPTARKNAQGQYSVNDMATALKFQGMSDDQIIAFVNQRAAETDPATSAAKTRAMIADNLKGQRSYIAQNELYGGVIGRAYRTTLDVGHSVTSAFSNLGSGFAEEEGGLNDSITRGTDNWRYKSTLNAGVQVKNVKDFLDNDAKIGGADKTVKTTVSQLNTRFEGITDKGWNVGNILPGITRDTHAIFDSKVLSSRESLEGINKINSLAKSGDEYATKFIDSKDEASRGKALADLLVNRGDAFGDLASQLSGKDRSANTSDFVKDSLKYEVTQVKNGSTQGVGKYQESLNRVTGGKLGVYDSLRAIGEFSDLSDIANDNKLNQYNIDDVLKDNKYKEVRGLLKNVNQKDKVKYVTDAFRASSMEGLTSIGVLANAGVDMEAAKKNPSLISDPTVRKQFLDAKTDEEKQGILAGDIINHNQGIAKTQGLKSADKVTLDEVKGFEQRNIDFSKQSSKNYEAAKSDQFDYQTFQQNQNAIDFGKATNDFGQHVKDFGEAVKTLPGAKEDNSSPTAPGSHWYNNLFGGGSSDDGKRSGGPVLGNK
jgi:hypothetical protein